MARKNFKGFTLIELIVVMVIIGILAATAAPKFINLEKDARIARLQGLKGAINSANNLARAAAIAQGVDMEAGWTAKADKKDVTDYEKTPFVEMNGVRYGMNKGYLDRLYIVAFLESTQDFQTETVGGKVYAKQNDKSNTANTLCKSVNKTKTCEYEWCACAGKTNKDYDSEFFVPQGANIYDATNAASEKCYLIYRNPPAVNEPAIVKIESSGC